MKLNYSGSKWENRFSIRMSFEGVNCIENTEKMMKIIFLDDSHEENKTHRRLSYENIKNYLRFECK